MEATIRPVCVQDAPEIAAIYEHFVRTSPATFDIVPPTSAEIAQRIDAYTKTYPWFVAEVAGTVVGYAYASKHRDREAYRWSVDVSAYIHPDHVGKGLGRALYTPLLDTLKQQGFANAFAGITLPNDASVGLHKAMGFELLGVYRNVGHKLGRWHDTSWWQLSLGNLDPEPGEPIPWSEL